MSQEGSTLTFEEITEADIPELTDVMTRAFDDDAQKHLGKQRGGPPGYDNGDFFRQWLFGQTFTDGFKVLAHGKIVAAAIMWDLPDGHNILGAMFVDPAAQDGGVGTRLWRFIEERYTQAQSWRLATPVWATKNHYFYEQKCGFHRIAAHQMPGVSEDEVVYRKDTAMAEQAPAQG
jgi:GNAT superfamily N-acetyltransferase